MMLMVRGRMLIVLTVVLSAMVVPAGWAADPPDTTWQTELESLRARLAQQDERLARQETELKQLRAQQEEQQHQPTAAEVDQVVRAVMQDAEKRSTLGTDSWTAGWKDGFFLRSEDDRFLLRIFGQIQTRYIFSSSDDARDESTSPPTDLDDTRGGFEVSRLRIGFKGNVIDPSWQYLIWGGFHSDGSGLLLDAYIKKDLGGGLSLTAGQFKMPLLYEWMVSETRQQFIERSLLSGCFCGHYTQGVMLTYQKDPARLFFSLNDGLGAVNSAWNADAGGAMAQTGRAEGVAVTGRAEWRLAGEWKQYDDFEGWTGEDPLVVLGAAAHFQQGEYGTSGTTLRTGDESHIIRWTVDASIERGGANLFAAFIGNHLSDADQVPNLNQYAAMLQAGYFINPQLELMARYEWGDLDVPGAEDLHLVTVGFSRFFARHQIKWTNDVGYSFNPLNRVSLGGNTFGWSNDFAGWRPDAAESDGQFVFRTQLQLVF